MTTCLFNKIEMFGGFTRLIIIRVRPAYSSMNGCYRVVGSYRSTYCSQVLYAPEHPTMDDTHHCVVDAIPQLLFYSNNSGTD